MKSGLAVIRTKEDFNELRKYKNKERLVIVFLNDIDFKNEKLNPIHLPRTEVIILGRGKIISNLQVVSDGVETGLFSKVRSLYVKGLNFDQVSVLGTDIIGTIAGSVAGEVKIVNSNISSKLKGNAYIGGFVGVCKELNIESSSIVLDAEGIDFIGGYSSMSRSLNINNVSKSVNIKAHGRTISEETPYVEKEQEAIIERMLIPLLKDKKPIDY